MLLSPRKNGLTSLFKEVRVFKACVGHISSGASRGAPHGVVRPVSKAQIKHTKNFSIKNFGTPKTPPLKFFMFGLFPVF